MSGLVVKNNNELWFNNNKLSTSTGTKGLYIDNNRNLFFNNVKIASGNISNPKGLHLVNNELAYDGNKFGTELNVLIRSLFANNEQGFAFDFNDLSTMYQDTIGTIPVTSVGQPVGLVLDKSKELALGNNIVNSKNQTGNTPTATITYDGEWWNIFSTASSSIFLGIRQDSLSPGSYKITFSFKQRPVNSRITIEGSNGQYTLSPKEVNGSLSVIAQVNTSFVVFFRDVTVNSGYAGSFKIDSIISLSGNHATQTTSSKRPILRQNATTGAYYLAFDGVDDFLVTANIDFSAADDFTMFLGNTKLNDTIMRNLFNIWNSSIGDSTMFALWVGGGVGGSTESFTSKHPSTGYNVMTKSSYPSFNAPKDTVVTLKYDNISKKHLFTLNRLVTQQTTIANTNKIANYPLYIGSKTESACFFNGNLYSLIGITRLATDAEITNTENAIAKNVGVTL